MYCFTIKDLRLTKHLKEREREICATASVILASHHRHKDILLSRLHWRPTDADRGKNVEFPSISHEHIIRRYNNNQFV